MDAEDAIGDYCSYGEEVEGIGYDFPCLHAHSSFALVVESI
jgi:hypothetical protein